MRVLPRAASSRHGVRKLSSRRRTWFEGIPSDTSVDIHSMKPLKPFNRIEKSLESMIEGAINRVFRPAVQPSEIARKLVREMSDNRLVSVRGTIVPNAFEVGLNAQDFESFAGSEAVISDHIEEWLGEEAERLGFTLLGPIEVRLTARDQTKPRSITIEGSIAESDNAHSRQIQTIERTEAFVVQRSAILRQSWILEVTGGPLAGIAHWIAKRETTIGRSLDNDFVIDAPDVSRHHAVLELQDQVLRVIDMGSLNGTFVNQRQVHNWALVNPGDSLTFGLVTAQVFVDTR